MKRCSGAYSFSRVRIKATCIPTIFDPLQLTLKTKKSPGPDAIPNVVWKEFAFELFPALADIYNSSLEQGYFPTQLQQAIMVPVPKIRPPKSVENDLRPMSLTSPIAKVLEGFSAESLITSVFNKLDNKQFALPGRSTTYAHYFGNTGHLWQIH